MDEFGPLHAALAYGFDPSSSDSLILRQAAYSNRVDVVRLLLLDGRADPAAKGNEALLHAAETGHAELVSVLLADGRANPAAMNSAALRSAVLHGRAGVVRALLADGRADPTIWDCSLIRLAMSVANAEVTDALSNDIRVRMAMAGARLTMLSCMAAARRGVRPERGFAPQNGIDVHALRPGQRRAATIAHLLQQRRVGRFRGTGVAEWGLELVEPFGRNVLMFL